MRFPKIFLGLFSISAGFAIAAALGASGPTPLVPALSKFRPPAMSYQPGTAPSGVLGDFVWAVGNALAWLQNTPSLLAETLNALGVPPIIATVLLVLAAISFAAWLLYMVSGRVVFP